VSDGLELRSYIAQPFPRETWYAENEWLDYLSENEPVDLSRQAFWGAGSMISKPHLTRVMRAFKSIQHSNGSSERFSAWLERYTLMKAHSYTKSLSQAY